MPIPRRTSKISRACTRWSGRARRCGSDNGSSRLRFLDPLPHRSVCSGHFARCVHLLTPRRGNRAMSLATPAAVSSQETSTQPFLVRRAAVLGAGTMGSRIAAHLANAGIPSLLLDMLPRDTGEARNKLALAAVDALGKSKPAAFYE